MRQEEFDLIPMRCWCKDELTMSQMCYGRILTSICHLVISATVVKENIYVQRLFTFDVTEQNAVMIEVCTYIWLIIVQRQHNMLKLRNMIFEK